MVSIFEMKAKRAVKRRALESTPPIAATVDDPEARVKVEVELGGEAPAAEAAAGLRTKHVKQTAWRSPVRDILESSTQEGVRVCSEDVLEAVSRCSEQAHYWEVSAKTANQKKAEFRAHKSAKEEAESLLAASQLRVAGQDKMIQELKAALSDRDDEVKRLVEQIAELDQGFNDLRATIKSAHVGRKFHQSQHLYFE